MFVYLDIEETDRGQLFEKKLQGVGQGLMLRGAEAA